MYRAALKRARGVCPQSTRGLAQLLSYARHDGDARCHVSGPHRYSVVTRGYGTGAEEPFLNGSSGSYIDAMYDSWQADRSSVHKVN